MLIRLHEEIEKGAKVALQKERRGEDVTRLGAFSRGDVIVFRMLIPARMGARAVVLRIGKDGEDAADLPLEFRGRDAGNDVYEREIDTGELCGGAVSGLFFYEFLLLRGLDTLFTDSVNNVDFELTAASATRFRMLVYAPDFRVPEWFRGGTMYHIFPDRFCRGDAENPMRPGAVLNPDWEHGVPQFAEKNGDPLENNLFFGGNLQGVTQKLDYLQSLGVTVLYLSPIFEAASNHRYDTGNYERIDRFLGGEDAFRELIREAHARGIRVILDGVFNHTGDDSVYFNRRGNYPTLGAYQSEESPYAAWYSFREFPDDYECWWGIPILPRLNQSDAGCREYFCGKDGIAAKWLRAGADGWRLDVADELPDEFLDELRQTAARESGGNAILIGEVWENAADKLSYGRRRRYLQGRQLDSVMNYPFRNAVLALLINRDAETFYHILTELYGSYPPDVCHALMNLLGTHDTERILTLLGDPTAGAGKTNRQLSAARLSESDRARAVRLLRIASALQFTVFGVPSIYYGDEAGLEGYHDPFCRMPFPWGREEQTLGDHYRALGRLRREHPCLADGEFRFLGRWEHAVAYERARGNDKLIAAVNMDEAPLDLPLPGAGWADAFSGEDAGRTVSLAPESFRIFKKDGRRRQNVANCTQEPRPRRTE